MVCRLDKELGGVSNRVRHSRNMPEGSHCIKISLVNPCQDQINGFFLAHGHHRKHVRLSLVAWVHHESPKRRVSKMMSVGGRMPQHARIHPASQCNNGRTSTVALETTHTTDPGFVSLN